MSQFITKGVQRNLVLKGILSAQVSPGQHSGSFACVSLLPSHTRSTKFENPNISVFLLLFKLNLQFDLQLLRRNDASQLHALLLIGGSYCQIFTVFLQCIRSNDQKSTVLSSFCCFYLSTFSYCTCQHCSFPSLGACLLPRKF